MITKEDIMTAKAIEIELEEYKRTRSPLFDLYSEGDKRGVEREFFSD